MQRTHTNRVHIVFRIFYSQRLISANSMPPNLDPRLKTKMEIFTMMNESLYM